MQVYFGDNTDHNPSKKYYRKYFEQLGVGYLESFNQFILEANLSKF